uniref:Uncharacterized protein n=1 Tax=Cucumis melo TaxID=3656 RepID=A0A9I9E8L8_CUCME
MYVNGLSMLLRPSILSYCFSFTLLYLLLAFHSIFLLYILHCFDNICLPFTLVYIAALFSYHGSCLISYSQHLFEVLYTLFFHSIVHSILWVQNYMAAYYCLFHLFTLYAFLFIFWLASIKALPTCPIFFLYITMFPIFIHSIVVSVCIFSFVSYLFFFLILFI